MGLIEEQIERNRREQKRGKAVITIVKLPCGCASAEIKHPGDQWLQCPVCHKRILLTWSRTGNNKIISDK